MSIKTGSSLGAGVLLAALMAVGLSGEARAYPAAAPVDFSPFTGQRAFASPLSLNFGPVGLNLPVGSSPEWDVKIYNTGSQNLTNIASGTPSSPFGYTNLCPAELAPNFTCLIRFRFQPTQTGVFSGSDTINTSAGPFTIQLRGEGSGPQAYLDWRALDFGNLPIFGSPAPGQIVHLVNPGRSLLTDISGGAATAPFTSLNECSPTLNPGSACHITYGFNPTSSGFFSQESVIQTSLGPLTVTLYGSSGRLTPGPHPWVTPLEIDFGPVGLGVQSPTITTTVGNQGSDPLANFAGGNPTGDFGGGQDCSGGVPPGGSCHYVFDFTPSLTGEQTTRSTTNTNGGTFTITLHGEGIPPAFTVATPVIDFGPVAAGQTSATNFVFIQNSGLGSLSATLVDSAPALEPFQLFGLQGCTTVPAKNYCLASFAFTSPGPGRYHRVVHFNTNAGPLSFDLWGGEEIKLFLPVLEK
jgi:hypothetical protein